MTCICQHFVLFTACCRVANCWYLMVIRLLRFLVCIITFLRHSCSLKGNMSAAHFLSTIKHGGRPSTSWARCWALRFTFDWTGSFFAATVSRGCNSWRESCNPWASVFFIVMQTRRTYLYRQGTATDCNALQRSCTTGVCTGLRVRCLDVNFWRHLLVNMNSVSSTLAWSAPQISTVQASRETDKNVDVLHRYFLKRGYP